MHQVQVKVKDVIWPFVLLFVVNFALLLSWTLVEPLEWSRIEVENFDMFGRSVESFGSCFVYVAGHTATQDRARIGFLIALGLFNLGAVILANYESYRTRHLPSDFNESFYLALSMVSILEGFLIGVPILFLGYKTPTVFFVVASLFISFLCLGILLPTFVSKLLIRRRKSGLNKGQWHAAWSSYCETTGRRRRHSKDVHSRFPSSASFHDADNQHGNAEHRTIVADIRARAEYRVESKQEDTALQQGSSCLRTTVADSRARAARADQLAQQEDAAMSEEFGTTVE